jgi:hypothetical protein
MTRPGITGAGTERRLGFSTQDLNGLPARSSHESREDQRG